MHPTQWAQRRPSHPALIMVDSSSQISYRALEEKSNQGAHLLRSLGLRHGDAIALWCENIAGFMEIFWAAQRVGLYLTPVSTRLTAAEAAYIVDDSGASVLIASRTIGAAVDELMQRRADLCPKLKFSFMLSGNPAAWEEQIASQPRTRVADEAPGMYLLYSSGTTGRPKGVKLPLPETSLEADTFLEKVSRDEYSFDENAVLLTPAPLYHAAPLVYSMLTQRLGGTVVLMPKFDPVAALEAIQRYRVTHVQLVPTMFVRILKLSAEIRNSFDLSSLKVVVHAGAPCPVEIKRAMIDWLGPIIYEYYGGSEGNGSTSITSEQWLKKPGSVGKANWGNLHICREDGEEVPVGEEGIVYFEGGFPFQYLNDPEKTARSRNPRSPSWSTLGDIGRVDEDGYLFLTDRRDFVINCGGVNIYPQEAENVLACHPAVADVAVFGVPDPEMGEVVKAVVQPIQGIEASNALAEELLQFCFSRLSKIKCPRTIDFRMELPRHDTGKLYKKILKDEYWKTQP